MKACHWETEKAKLILHENISQKTCFDAFSARNFLYLQEKAFLSALNSARFKIRNSQGFVCVAFFAEGSGERENCRSSLIAAAAFVFARNWEVIAYVPVLAWKKQY